MDRIKVTEIVSLAARKFGILEQHVFRGWSYEDWRAELIPDGSPSKRFFIRIPTHRRDELTLIFTVEAQIKASMPN